MNSPLKYLLIIFSVHLISPGKAAVACERIHATEGLKKKISQNLFPSKLYRFIDEITAENESNIVKWNQEGTHFKLLSKRLVESVLKRHFNTSTLSSLQKQLYLYGFMKVKDKESYIDGYYHHPFFQRGMPELLANIVRKKTSPRRSKKFLSRQVSQELEFSHESYSHCLSAIIIDLKIFIDQLNAEISKNGGSNIHDIDLDFIHRILKLVADHIYTKVKPEQANSFGSSFRKILSPHRTNIVIVQGNKSFESRYKEENLGIWRFNSIIKLHMELARLVSSYLSEEEVNVVLNRVNENIPALAKLNESEFSSFLLLRIQHHLADIEDPFNMN